VRQERTININPILFAFDNMEFEAWPASNPEFIPDTSADGSTAGISIASGSSLYSSHESVLSSSPDSLGDPSPSPKRVLRRGRSTRKQRHTQPMDVDMTTTSTNPDSPSSMIEDSSSTTAESAGRTSSVYEFSSLTDRCDAFVENARVFHALFGTGVVCANDGVYLAIRFDDLRFGVMKLKATFAVPKMVLIPNY